MKYALIWNKRKVETGTETWEEAEARESGVPVKANLEVRATGTILRDRNY